MKPVILAVEDDSEILDNIQIVLQSNNYQPIPAKNGKEAYLFLNQMKRAPDLIISDMKMPTMDGYDFYLKISENPDLNTIPFIFLTSSSEPDDIRFGKKLTVEDFIVKPFKDEELLKAIQCKIKQKKKRFKIDMQLRVEKLVAMDKVSVTDVKKVINLKDLMKPSKSLFILNWDDVYGPQLVKSITNKKKLHYSMEDIGEQLYNASIALYGHHNFYKAQGILLRVENIHMDAYIFFDTIKSDKMRGGFQQFMIAYIASTIPYLESLRIQEICEDLSKQIKKNKAWELEEYWYKLLLLHKE